MEPGLVIGLSITMILVFAIVMERFRLPMVLGVLMAGMVMGPSSPLRGVVIGPFPLDALIIDEPGIVQFFALLGSVLILFGIGLEFSIVRLGELGLSTFLAALIKLGVTYLIGYSVSIAMGLGAPAAVLLGLLLSFSSTPIVIKILEANGKVRRPETPFILAVLIIEDLLAVVLLGILATSGLGDQYAMAMAVLKILVTFVFAYILLSHLIRRLLALVQHSDEMLVLFVVSIVLVISYICQSIGLGFSVGSFLAGSVVAASAQARRVEEMVRPFNALFASFFFFSIGMLVNVGATVSALPLLMGLVVVATVGKFAGSLLGAYLSGLPGTSSSFAAIALLPLGELSLLIGASAEASGLLPQGLVGLLASVIMITSLLSVFLVGFEMRIYNQLKGMMPEMLGRNMRLLRSTSLGMQKAVEENSRYQRIVSRLPTIANTKSWSYSSHDQLALALKNVLLLALLTAALYLILALEKGPLLALAMPFHVFIFLGFYSAGTLALVNTSTAFRLYIRLLGHSGRSGLELAAHLGGLLAFGAVGVFALLGGMGPEKHLLIFLLPVAVLGSTHAGAVLTRLRRLALRFQ